MYKYSELMHLFVLSKVTIIANVIADMVSCCCMHVLAAANAIIWAKWLCWHAIEFAQGFRVPSAHCRSRNDVRVQMISVGALICCVGFFCMLTYMHAVVFYLVVFLIEMRR